MSGRTARAVRLAVLLVLTASVVHAPVGAQGQEVQFVSMREVLQVERQSGAEATNVTNQQWTLTPDTAILIRPDLEGTGYRNASVIEALLRMSSSPIPNPFGGGQGCTGAPPISAYRVTASYTNRVTWSTLPPGAEPLPVEFDHAECATFQGLIANVTAHVQRWASGARPSAWLLRMDGEDGSFTSTFLSMDLTVEPDPPELGSARTLPRQIGPIALAPVGSQFKLTVALSDSSGDIQAATLSANGTTLQDRPVGKKTNVTFVVDVVDTTPEGPLSVTAVDWDGNAASRSFGELRLDATPPAVGVLTAPGAPVDQDASAQITIAATDDACQHVPAASCLNVTVLLEDGTELYKGTGDGERSFVVPTAEAGDHVATVFAQDAVGRQTVHAVPYAVRETRPPLIGAVTAAGALGRVGVTEAGLPFTLTVAATDETPGLVATVAGGEQPATANVTGGQAVLRVRAPVGETTLSVTVTDRWGNQAQASTRVTVEPATRPVVRIPAGGPVPATPTLRVEIDDLSVGKENVTVDLVGGTGPLPGVLSTPTVGERGILLDVAVPRLVHRERVALTVTATDALGQATQAQAEYIADAEPPRITVTPAGGAFDGTLLWTTPEAPILVTAEDADSGLVTLEVAAPRHVPLQIPGDEVTAADTGEGEVTLRAVDGAGNEAVKRIDIRVDETAPVVRLGIDGHDLVLDVEETGSGLRSLNVFVEGVLFPVAITTGEQRAEVPEVRRGQSINVTVQAIDKVGSRGRAGANLVVGDGAPVIGIGDPADGRVLVTADDPDADLVDIVVHAVHAVNGTRVRLQIVAGEVTLPDWSGDVALEVTARAAGATSEDTKAFVLGPGPYLRGGIDGTPRPGKPFTVSASWDRAYDRVEVVGFRDGAQLEVVQLRPAGPGHGTATVTFDDEGTYALTLRAIHPSGAIEEASLGEASVRAATNPLLYVLIALAVIGAVGLVIMAVARKKQG